MKSAAPMKAGGRDLTGALFGSLVAQYCEAINGGRLPSVSDAWEAVVERENRAAADRVFLEFQALCERRRLDPPMALQSALLDGIEEAMTQYQHLALDRDHQPARDELRNRLGAHQTQVCTAAVSTYALRIKEEAEALSRPPAASLVELRSRFEKASAESNHPQEWQGAAFSGMWDAVERFSSKRESEHLSTQLAEAKLATERAQGAAVQERMEIEEEAKEVDRGRRSQGHGNHVGAGSIPTERATCQGQLSRGLGRALRRDRARRFCPPRTQGGSGDAGRGPREAEHTAAPPEIDTAALEMAEAAAAEASDKLRRAEAKMEEDAVRLLALEAEVEELNATRAERDDLKDRIRSHAEELARASAAADELERRSSEEAERTEKSPKTPCLRCRPSFARNANGASGNARRWLPRPTPRPTHRQKLSGKPRRRPNRPVARWRETSKSTGRKSGPYGLRRLGEGFRDRTIRLEPARAGHDGGRRTKGDHGAPRACHLPEPPARARYERHPRRAGQAAHRRSSRIGATSGHRRSEARGFGAAQEALETELTELQQRLTGGQQATADRAALRRELEAVRAMKDDVESRLAEARRESSDAVQARRSLEQRHRSEMSSLKVTYERQIANLEDRLEDLQQQ